MFFPLARSPLSTWGRVLGSGGFGGVKAWGVEALVFGVHGLGLRFRFYGFGSGVSGLGFRVHAGVHTVKHLGVEFSFA